MKPESFLLPPAARSTALISVLLAGGLVYVASCASSSPGASTAPASDMSTSPPRPDPRIGLRGGLTDAAQAAWNMRLVSNTMSPDGFAGVTNSDLAFAGNFVFQGNYNGYQVWDVSNPARPTLKSAYLCPASQSDVSVYGNLLFVSGEGMSGRTDCGTQGVQDSVSVERLRGIRILDITDIANPKYVANVQTCRGSHTHTVVSDPDDRANVYIYISGSSRVRSPRELPGCLDAPITDPNTSRFRIEVVQVPLAVPQQARIVGEGRIFDDLTAPPRHANPPEPGRGARVAAAGRGGEAGGGRAGGGGGRGGGGGGGGARGGPNQCHDITVYPAIGLAGGACGGYGLLLDIRDVRSPKRLAAVADSNMSFWHSATFSNDGSKILFTDEWGGGSSPRCRATDKYEWGANAIFTVRDTLMTFRSYYKMPAAQTHLENCVAHNGSLIPIPGREVMVQAWYQGGVSVFDWTDPARPIEIAFFDRGPVTTDTTAARGAGGGSWSAYWYNGYIYSSEIARGLDVFEVTPSGFMTQNEIDAAKTVRYEQLNAQEQPEMVWPPSFALARAYLDQLARSNGLASARITAVRNELATAEGRSGQQRRDALARLATQLSADAGSATDQARVRTLAAAVSDLANAQR